ncbi:MAG TPA: signal peptidase I [Phycisphaerales bacterium]|nr:signal peptidase I [Phycisphaerales bacterium]
MATDAPSKTTPAPSASPVPPPESLKDTLISIMIAFTMAFVFRGFVIEAFVIPTGSMGPTLMGAHVRLRGPTTGASWPVGARDAPVGDNTNYFSHQTFSRSGIQDPISGEPMPIPPGGLRTFSGDRILVLKYLYGLRDPDRFDVIVFKNPSNPLDNYIKRLIGLPGEQIALADGDVFVRTGTEGQVPAGDDPQSRAALWDAAGWTIARKDPIVQRAVWQQVYDTALAPFPPTGAITPWNPGDPAGWSMTAREYTFDGPGSTALVFDQTRRRSSRDIHGERAANWTIDDYYPYDEPYYEDRMVARYPVSDVRIRCGFKPSADGQSIGMHLSARGHEFRATIGKGTARIAIRRPVGAPGIKSEWETVATQPAPALPANAFSNVEFWHVDQSVQIWLNGRKIAEYDYDWSPAQRLRFATGRPFVDLMQDQARDPQGRNTLAEPGIYAPCSVRFEFDGGSFSITRVGLDRDLHYQPTSKGRGHGGISGLGTSPYAPLYLGPDQFFACGDNSPASLDGRLWESVDPWVHELYPPSGGNASPHPSAGVIPRELLLGKAFFVYWPSLRFDGDPVPVPDFGRMRFIW